MMDFSYLGLITALLVGACAPASPKTERASVPASEKSLVMARLTPSIEADLVSVMQSRLLRTPLSGRVTTHGWENEGLYTLEFVGSCNGQADLVSAVIETARVAGATETSCVPAVVFAPGEPVVFRRGLITR